MVDGEREMQDLQRGLLFDERKDAENEEMLRESEEMQRGTAEGDTTTATEEKKQEYQDYITAITPVHCWWKQMGKAFLVGGLICCLGQFILWICKSRFGLDEANSAIACSLILIFLTDLFTGFGVYPKLVKWGGAGALVPITGFANSICAEAIEYKKEGWVFGVGCKIFNIAGPVILYGVFVSWLLGLIYWAMHYFM